MSSRSSDEYLILMLVCFLCFTISAMKIKIDSVPTASALNELLLPSHSPNDSSRCNPFAVNSTQPKPIQYMCFTDPSDTATKYPSLLCALSTSSIGVSSLPYFVAFSAN